MGIELKLKNTQEREIDATDPLEVFPHLPKTWDAMSDTQLVFWLKQLARYGKTEQNIRAKIEKTGYMSDVAIEHNQNSQAYTIRIHGHKTDWVQSS